MISRSQLAVARLIGRKLEHFLTADQREWGIAMSSEIDSIPNGGDALGFVIG